MAAEVEGSGLGRLSLFGLRVIRNCDLKTHGRGFSVSVLSLLHGGKWKPALPKQIYISGIV